MFNVSSNTRKATRVIAQRRGNVSMIAFWIDKRGLHDLICDTVAVRVPPNPLG